MSRKHNNYLYGKESKKQRFVGLTFDFIESDAYRYLSNAALRVLVELKHKFNGANNGDIVLSCRQIEHACKISRNTASRAFAELQSKGIITKTKQGYFGMRIACTWKLNTDKNAGENRPSNEWKNWRPGMDLTVAI